MRLPIAVFQKFKGRTAKDKFSKKIGALRATDACCANCENLSYLYRNECALSNATGTYHRVDLRDVCSAHKPIPTVVPDRKRRAVPSRAVNESIVQRWDRNRT
jgi:hypothetical protein